MDVFGRRLFEFRNGELQRACRCPKCGRQFDQRSKLMLHITTKHNSLRSATGKLYQCAQCNIKFLYQQSLRKHIETHHHIISYTSTSTFGSVSADSCAADIFVLMCRECDQRFDCEYDLWCHMMLHALEKPIPPGRVAQFRCDHCSAIFFHPRDFAEHRKTSHRHRIELRPHKLRAAYDNNNHGFDSFMDHAEMRRKRLYKPSNSIVITGNAEKRMQKHFVCKLCNAHFDERLHLKWHMNLHPKRFAHFSVDRLFDMLKCGVKFDLLAQRRSHWADERERMLQRGSQPPPPRSRPHTMDASVLDNFANRFRKLTANIGSALARLVPRSRRKPKEQIHGIDKLIRNSCPNWYV